MRIKKDTIEKMQAFIDSLPEVSKNKCKLTQKRLKELFKYKKKKGIFIRRVITSNNTHVGEVAGSLDKTSGYVQISIDGKIYRAHRLVFLYKRGYFPEHDVDHRNGVRKDNRWKNLREVTRSCNLQNICVNRNNKTGFPGIHSPADRNKYLAQIIINGNKHHLGSYDNKLEAALARFTAEVDSPSWTCNYRSELAKAIKKVWPEFNPKE